MCNSTGSARSKSQACISVLTPAILTWYSSKYDPGLGSTFSYSNPPVNSHQIFCNEMLLWFGKLRLRRWPSSDSSYNFHLEPTLTWNRQKGSVTFQTSYTTSNGTQGEIRFLIQQLVTVKDNHSSSWCVGSSPICETHDLKCTFGMSYIEDKLYKTRWLPATWK